MQHLEASDETERLPPLLAAERALRTPGGRRRLTLEDHKLGLMVTVRARWPLRPRGLRDHSTTPWPGRRTRARSKSGCKRYERYTAAVNMRYERYAAGHAMGGAGLRSMHAMSDIAQTPKAAL